MCRKSKITIITLSTKGKVYHLFLKSHDIIKNKKNDDIIKRIVIDNICKINCNKDIKRDEEDR